MKINIYTFAIVTILICSALSVKAQYPNVMVSDVENPNETSIYINPKNTKQIIAGANLNSYYFSFDGGRNGPDAGIATTFGKPRADCVGSSRT